MWPATLQTLHQPSLRRSSGWRTSTATLAQVDGAGGLLLRSLSRGPPGYPRHARSLLRSLLDSLGAVLYVRSAATRPHRLRLTFLRTSNK